MALGSRAEGVDEDSAWKIGIAVPGITDRDLLTDECVIGRIRYLLERGRTYNSSGKKLDAIAYLWKEIGTTCIHLSQTHDMVKLFRAVLDLVAPDVIIPGGRHALTVSHPDEVASEIESFMVLEMGKIRKAAG